MRPGPPDEQTATRPDVGFAEAVQPVVGRLVHISRRILGCDYLAWEAVQEALLGLWLQESAPPNPRAWLIRAVFYRSLHLARTIRRRRKHERRACLGRPEAIDRDDPSLALLAEELREELMRTLARLDGKHRIPLSLHLIEGMDYESIARELGVPIGTVRSRLNRARAAMRSLVEGSAS